MTRPSSRCVFAVSLLLWTTFIPTEAAIFVKIPDIDGESRNPARGEDGWIALDSMQFGVDRSRNVRLSSCPRECQDCKRRRRGSNVFLGEEEEEDRRRGGTRQLLKGVKGYDPREDERHLMKESGEKGGTADINIGLGELQECTITKSMDMASAKLAQFAVNGVSLGDVEIDFIEGRQSPRCYLRYKLERCFVKSWSTSGDADDRPTEEVAFYYNKIAFAYQSTKDGVQAKHHMGWDNVCNLPYSAEEAKIPDFNLVPIYEGVTCPSQTPPRD